MTGARNRMHAPEHVQSLLAKLHKQSLEEEDQLRAPGGGYEAIRSQSEESPDSAHELVDELMRDKFIALDEDKSLFVYSLLRTIGALNVVEAGTSYGVSTIYLATAVGENAAAAKKQPGEARIIATEHESAKAVVARKHWKEAGATVEPWIELREGNVLDTLKEPLPPIDFVLLDIWTPLVLPIIKILEPHMRSGCVIVADNISKGNGYDDYLNHITARESGYSSVTLPFSGGLEMTTYRRQ